MINNHLNSDGIFKIIVIQILAFRFVEPVPPTTEDHRFQKLGIKYNCVYSTCMYHIDHLLINLLKFRIDD